MRSCTKRAKQDAWTAAYRIAVKAVRQGRLVSELHDGGTQNTRELSTMQR